MIYVGWYRPFIFHWMNSLELFNENLIIYSTYFHFLYSDGFLLTTHPKLDDQVKDTETTNQVAWGHVTLLGLIVFVNMLAMITVQIHTLYKRIKLRYLRYVQQKKAKAVA